MLDMVVEVVMVSGEVSWDTQLHLDEIIPTSCRQLAFMGGKRSVGHQSGMELVRFVGEQQ